MRIEPATSRWSSQWIFGTSKLNVLTWLELLLLCMSFYLCSYSDFFSSSLLNYWFPYCIQLYTWSTPKFWRIWKLADAWRPSKQRHYWKQPEYWEESWRLEETCCHSISREIHQKINNQLGSDIVSDTSNINKQKQPNRNEPPTLENGKTTQPNNARLNNTE